MRTNGNDRLREAGMRNTFELCPIDEARTARAVFVIDL